MVLHREEEVLHREEMALQRFFASLYEKSSLLWFSLGIKMGK
jgi:hypothetical protein